MSLQPTVKVAAFTALGFAFLFWLPLLARMIVVSFLGTMTGEWLLKAAVARSAHIVLPRSC